MLVNTKNLETMVTIGIWHKIRAKSDESIYHNDITSLVARAVGAESNKISLSIKSTRYREDIC